VYYDGVVALTTPVRAGTLLFQLTAPCPCGSRMTHATLGWVAGDKWSYAADSCIDQKLVVDVSQFNYSRFVDGLPRYLQLTYKETAVHRPNR